MNNNYLELRYSKEQIENKVAAYAKYINDRFKGEVLYCLGVMNGCLFFMSDLLKKIDVEVRIDSISVASYNKGKSEAIKLYKNIAKDITNQHVLLIDDVIDTGKTMAYTIDLLKKLSPKTISVVAVVDKKAAHEELGFEYHALFESANDFLVGYGMDYDDKYRQLDQIYVYKGPMD